MKLHRSTRFVIFFSITIMAMALLNSGCTTAKKATRYMHEHPEVAAEVCAEMFPVKDTVIKGDSIVVTDTLWGQEIVRDSVTVNDTVRITTTLPGKTITKTVRVTDTIVRENTARVATLENQLKEAIDEGLSLSRDRDHYKSKYEELDKADKGKLVIRIPWWIVIVVCAGVGAVTVMKLKGIALNPLRWFG